MLTMNRHLNLNAGILTIFLPILQIVSQFVTACFTFRSKRCILSGSTKGWIYILPMTNVEVRFIQYGLITVMAFYNLL